MGDIKTDKFTIKEVGDAELHLAVEEEQRDCVPCIYLLATGEDGKDYPAILLKDRLKNKGMYIDTDVDSWWTVLLDRTKSVKLAFLKLTYKGAGTMKFCFDFSPRNKSGGENIVWFQHLIKSEGKVAITDGPEPAFMATGIKLDIAEMITEGRL